MIARQLRQLIDHTVFILTHPQSSPRETVTLAAIFVVIVLALLAFLSLFFAGKKTGEPAEETSEEPPRQLSLGLDLAVIGGVILITLSVLGIFFSNLSRQPSYCKSCHEMVRDHRSWARSSHARFECANCHQEPGFFGYTLFKLRQLEMVVERVNGSYEKPIKAAVENSACLQCHRQDIAGSIVVSGLKVRHREILEAGYRCTSCHKTVGHGESVQNAVLPSMDQCSACHDGKKAFATCSRCHTVDIGKNVRRTPDFPVAHLSSPTTCRGCHSIGKCTKCHGLEMPHPPSWLRTGFAHAPAAAFEKKQLCEHCHSAQFCNRCHKGFNGGHGPAWKEQHKTAAPPEDQSGCLGCHRIAPNMCGICHERYAKVKSKQPKGRLPQLKVPPGSKSF